MEIKLQDFPCFYYTSAKGKRNEQKKYYATVCSMLGYSLREASDSSEYFIRVSNGKLFEGTRFTEEELRSCGNAINNASSCSVNFNRLFATRHQVVSQCCAVCPLSPSYANARIEEEYIYLKAVIENREFLTQHPLESSMMRSFHSLTLSSDVGSYPIVPFNALLLEHIRSCENFEEESLHEAMVMKLKLYLDNMQFADDTLNEVLDVFVTATLRQIKNVTKEPVSEVMISEKVMALTMPYAYTPPRNVLPVTEENATRAERKQKAKSLSGQLGLEMIAQQLEENKNPAELLETETNNLLSEHGKEKLEEVSFSKSGATAEDFFSLLEMQKNSVFTNAEQDDVAAETEFSEDEESDIAKEESVVSEISETEDSPADGGKEVAKDALLPLENIEDIVFSEPKIEKFPSRSGEEISGSEEEREKEGPADVSSEKELPDEGIADAESAEEKDADTSYVTEEKTDKEITYKECDTIEKSDEENQTNPVTSSELAIYSFEPCSLCSHGASASVFNNILRTADSSTYAFFLRCMSKKPGKETFEAMRNKFGCALCPKKGSTVDCIYPSVSFRTKDKKKSTGNYVPRISADMLPYIYDCTDSQKLNLINFISDACNETHVSVECVEYFGVKGLMFYVSGRYYFFNPAYGSSGFLKPLFSDASKTRFYSVNPILVHECFYKMGFKQIRIESVAALFSAVHNLEVLAPLGFIFEGYMHRALLDDMYAHIMPYYSDVVEKLYPLLQKEAREEYENGLRFEWALGKNKDITMIAHGHENNVLGGCYLHYRITMRHFEDLNFPGVLNIVKINNDIPAKTKKRIFERTAGKLAASTSRVHNLTYLVGLSSESLAYYSCYEGKVFFDEMMACLRSAYRELAGDAPDVFAERTPFKY